jgi:hypothetical protein
MKVPDCLMYPSGQMVEDSECPSPYPKSGYVLVLITHAALQGELLKFPNVMARKDRVPNFGSSRELQILHPARALLGGAATRLADLCASPLAPPFTASGFPEIPSGRL